MLEKTEKATIMVRNQIFSIKGRELYNVIFFL